MLPTGYETPEDMQFVRAETRLSSGGFLPPSMLEQDPKDGEPSLEQPALAIAAVAS